MSNKISNILNFEEFIKVMGELGYAFSLDEDSQTYSLSETNFSCVLTIQLDKFSYLVKIFFKDTTIFFEGASHPLTFFYIHNCLEALKKFPYIFISVFYSNYNKDYPLSIFNERLMLGMSEWNYFLTNILKKDDWDGEEVTIYESPAKVSVLIDKTNIPFIVFIINKGDTFNMEIPLTLYDWLLDIKEELSWIMYNRTVFRISDIPKEVPFIDFFTRVFKAYGLELTESCFKNKISIPVDSSYLLKIDFYMNHLGVVLSLYTSLRPDKPFKIKLPYRSFIEQELEIFNKFMYIILTNSDLLSEYSLLPYLKYVDNIYMGMFVSSEEKEMKKDEKN